MPESILISVIVPVYNAATTLEKCINSILNQSFSDFELLLVDDGSTDSSGVICDNYYGKDRRITVFHKRNGGVSSARNLGLEHARGVWVAFVDADDWVEMNYLKNLIGHVDGTIDLVVSYARIYTKDRNQREIYPSKLITHENFEDMFVENDMHWHTGPWSKLYRHEIIRKCKLSFYEGMHISEDALFNFQFMMCARSIYISSDTDYCYSAETEGSLTKRVNTVDSEIQTCHNIADIVSNMIETMQIRHPKALHNLYYLNALNIRRVLNALYYNIVPRAERIEILRNADLDMYTHFIGQCSCKEEFFKLLLRWNLIVIYDCIRILIVSFKRYGRFHEKL